jgi:hypothetical protein
VRSTAASSAVKASSAGADTVAVKRAIPIAVLITVIALVAAVVMLSMHGSKSPPPSAPRATAIATPSTPALRTVTGTGFSTSYPSAWSVSSHIGRRGSSQHLLSSSGAAIDALGLGPAGTVAVTIDDTPTSGVRAGQRFSEQRLDAVRLLAVNVGTPEAAQAKSLAARPHAVALDGIEAGEESYVYTYEGRQNMQVDVVARHDRHIVLVELDAEPRLASASQAALTQILAAWHWS